MKNNRIILLQKFSSSFLRLSTDFSNQDDTLRNGVQP